MVAGTILHPWVAPHGFQENKKLIQFSSSFLPVEHRAELRPPKFNLYGNAAITGFKFLKIFRYRRQGGGPIPTRSQARSPERHV